MAFGGNRILKRLRRGHVNRRNKFLGNVPESTMNVGFDIVFRVSQVR